MEKVLSHYQVLIKLPRLSDNVSKDVIMPTEDSSIIDPGMRRVLRRGIVIVLLLLAVGCVWNLNGGSLDLRDREVRLIITDSMDGEPTEYEIPTIAVDSLVMIHDLGQDELDTLQIGDVLAFRQKGDVYTHRIIAIDSGSKVFTTHGDNTHANESVPFADAVGKVVGVSHPLGVMFTFVKENYVYIAIFLVFILSSWIVVERVMRSGSGNDPSDGSPGKGVPVGKGSLLRKEQKENE